MGKIKVRYTYLNTIDMRISILVSSEEFEPRIIRPFNSIIMPISKIDGAIKDSIRKEYCLSEEVELELINETPDYPLPMGPHEGSILGQTLSGCGGCSNCTCRGE